MKKPTSISLTESNFLKFFFLFFTTASIFFCFRQALKLKGFDDPITELKIIDTESRKAFGDFTAKVSVGMLIKGFSTFDLIKNTFIADLIVWFEYNVDQVMLEKISLFSFDNGDIVKKSAPDIRISEGRALVKFDVRVAFKSNLVYKRFPLENHRISLMLSNNFVTPAEMYFEIEDSGFKVDKEIFIPDWDISDVFTEAGFSSIGLDDKDSKAKSRASVVPKVRFTINLDKKGIKDIYIVFLPLYLASFIGTYSFLTSILNSNMRYVMASSTVPALLSYRFIIQNLIPQTSYFTITDYIYLLLLLTACFIFIFQAFFIRKAGHVLDGNKDSSGFYKALVENINTIVFVIINLIVLAGTYYFLNYL